MRKDITVAAGIRETRGKNAARRTRAAGEIPAVLYGSGGESIALAVSPKDVNRVLHSSTGHNTIFDVAVAGGETTPVMIVDWLHHPVRDTLMHVDLLRIDLSKRLRVKVPVHTTGDPVGVKIQGGHFEVISREIEIECLPDEIPENFTSDVSEMSIGGSLRAGEIELGGSMKLVSPADAVIAHVVALRTSDATAGAEGEPAAAGSEPEVVKKGKKEEGEKKDEKKK
ncbi:MAG: 50S ribosomal protein L25 [Bryobacteraceae bacterium]